MANNQQYAIGEGWKAILTEAGVDHVDVLRRARLPEDLLNRENTRLSSESFLRFFAAIDASIDDAGFWVRLTEAMRPEYFEPPVFAALCSPDLATAAERLARFKPLIGPLVIHVDNRADELELIYRWTDTSVKQPAYMHGLEAMFVTRLARLGTREHICPSNVEVPERPRNPQPFEDYLGVQIQRGEAIRVTFRGTDAHRPFLSANRAMWNIFEPELRQRLSDLEESSSFAERTRAVLMEALPSGQAGMNNVARRLGVSSRTLQRRLSDEDTTFKVVVDTTRERLALHYLRQTQLTATEIAFLLGFDEPTSFFRAFQRWTGTTPDSLRHQLASEPACTH